MWVKVDYSTEAKKNPRPNMGGEWAIYTKKHWWNKWVERETYADVGWCIRDAKKLVEYPKQGERAIAWLEKQGEQKFEMKTAEESLGIDSDTYNKIIDECILGEQKLTEFERGLFDMLTDISKPCTADCVKSHSKKLLSIARKMIALEQNPAWSEDDMKIALRTEYEKGRADAIAEMQWSEEDERMLHTIIADFKGFIRDNTSTLESHFNECIDWLKSLRPQNRWKPSDEQITWLYRAADDASKDSRMKQVLNNLLSDLKKLMEK